MENKLTPDERKLKWKLKPLIAVVLITAIGFIAYKKVPGLVMDTASQNKNAPVAQEKDRGSCAYR